jgi:hypothetical protein
MFTRTLPVLVPLFTSTTGLPKEVSSLHFPVYQHGQETSNFLKSAVHSKHVHRMGVTNQHKNYVEKFKIENYLQDLGIGGTRLLKRIEGVKCGL